MSKVPHELVKRATDARRAYSGGDAYGITNAALEAVYDEIRATALEDAERAMQDLLECSGDTRWRGRLLDLAADMRKGDR